VKARGLGLSLPIERCEFAVHESDVIIVRYPDAIDLTAGSSISTRRARVTS